MAPKIPNIIEEMRDYFQGEPIEDPEENDDYLDRLGVSESSDVAVPPPEMRSTFTPGISGVLSNEHIEAMTRAHDLRYSRDQFEQQYMSYFDRDLESPNIKRDYRREEEMMQWSNGDYEPRPRRRMPHRSRFYEEGNTKMFRTYTADYVHEQVDRQRVRMLQVILEDTQNLVYDFMERYGDNLPASDGEKILIELVDHFLEDLGKDLMLRHRVAIRRALESFSTLLHIEVEFPNMNPMRTTVDLELIRMRTRR